VASQPEDNRANEIRREMYEIRCELDDDVSQIRQTGITISNIIPGRASGLPLPWVF